MVEYDSTHVLVMRPPISQALSPQDISSQPCPYTRRWHHIHKTSLLRLLASLQEWLLCSFRLYVLGRYTYSIRPSRIALVPETSISTEPHAKSITSLEPASLK